MRKNPTSRFGFFNPRTLSALALCSGGVLLAIGSIAPPVRHSDGATSQGGRDIAKALRYMPEPGGKADDFDRMEAEWNSRLTYPTGIFNPEWLRLAAAADALIPRAIPAGVPGIFLKGPNAPLALTSTGFTALGPAPERMTGCSLCFDYTLTEGRVNDIVVDPTTTTPGSIVAYLGSDGGGVWKTTNCCTAATSWSVVTDDPLLATIAIDTLTIDPHNHNTIYAGTGDLNYGSFSAGSQGILKSTDAGATWTLLGADVFGPALPEPPGQFPQYQSVGKVRVDPRNSNNVVAGTKTGLYFSYDAGNTWTGPCTTNNFNTQRQDITGLELSDVGGSTRIIAAVGVRGFATTVQYNLNQNGANGIYKATMPASGCPSFTSIASDSNGFVYGAASTSYSAGANMHAGSGVACDYPVPIPGPTHPACASNTNQLGRIDIAVAPSDPNYIYVQAQSITPNNGQTIGGSLFSGCAGANGCQLGAWRSTDGGDHWTPVAGSAGDSLTDCSGQLDGDYPQNWYDQGIAVDPNNKDRVFFDTFEIWFWANGNTSWNDTTCGYSTVQSPLPLHVDQHALAFVPGSSSTLLAGSDGGVYVTLNADQASGTVKPAWINMDLGLNTIEFYSGDISANFATSAAPQANGGAQDNGSSSVTFTGSPTGPVQWQMGTGGDGFFARIDPVGADGTSQSLRFFQGGNGGLINRCVSQCTAGQAVWTQISPSWDTPKSSILPYEIFKGDLNNPANDCATAGPSSGCGHLIAGTSRVWETITGAAASPTQVMWYVNSPALTKGTLADRSFINQLAFEPADQTKVIVGTNDGNVQIGFGMGSGTANTAIWVDVTGSNVVLPNRPILDVAFDPTTTTAPKGYAAVGGFNANTPTTPGHVFQVVCTTNCVASVWTDKTGNLPDIPVDSIIANPNFPQQVFAGTDWGLYFTNDITAASPTWSRFDNGLPHAMIWDMQIDRGNTTLSVWTRSRGAYAWPLPSSPIPLPSLTGAVSRMTHGSAGTFDTILFAAAAECGPAGCPRGVESRSSASLGSGNYTMIFSFSSNLVSVAGATVTGHNPTSGTGSVSGPVIVGPNPSLGLAANQCQVNLTNVSNAQYLTVTLNSVVDTTTARGDVVGPQMAVLIGDVNATGGVDGNDVSAVQSHTRQAVNSGNFSYDVNATGGSIDGNDVSFTQSHTRTSLPSPP
jgi:hypothetical protein